MKGFGKFLIFLALCFAAAAFYQTRETKLEGMIRRSNEDYQKGTERSASLFRLATVVGQTDDADIDEHVSRQRSAWQEIEETKARLTSMKDEKEKRMWFLSGISGFSFLCGIICLSSGKSADSRNEVAVRRQNSAPRDFAAKRSAAVISNRNSGGSIATASPREDFVRGREECRIDPKAQILLWVKDEQQGPYVISQIRKMWDAGSITADSLYWLEGFEDWRELSPLMEGVECSAPKSPVEVAKVTFESGKEAFSGTMRSVVDLAVRSIRELRWTPEKVDHTGGVVTFRTASGNAVSGMIHIEEIEDGLFRVTDQTDADSSFNGGKRGAIRIIGRMRMIANS